MNEQINKGVVTPEDCWTIDDCFATDAQRRQYAELVGRDGDTIQEPVRTGGNDNG